MFRYVTDHNIAFVVATAVVALSDRPGAGIILMIWASAKYIVAEVGLMRIGPLEARKK